MQRKELTIMERVDRANNYVYKTKLKDSYVYSLYMLFIIIFQICLLVIGTIAIDILLGLR